MTDRDRLEPDWEQAKVENDAAPREPGRYKIEFGGAPVGFEHAATCESCGAALRSRGVEFPSSAGMPDPMGQPCSRHGGVLRDCPAKSTLRNALSELRGHDLIDEPAGAVSASRELMEAAGMSG